MQQLTCEKAKPELSKKTVENAVQVACEYNERQLYRQATVQIIVLRFEIVFLIVEFL